MHRRLLPLQQALGRFHQRVVKLARRTFTGRPRALAATISVLAVAVLASAGWVAWFAYDLTTGLPNRQALRGMGDMVQSTTIFDASDRPAFTIFKEQRIEVPLEKMSQNFINAVISVEDQRFFDHGGIDAVRIGGAVLKNLQSGRRSEGGSTITQQLARLMLPEPRQDLPSQAQGSHRRGLSREPVLEAGDPRDLSEQGVLRRRPARGRGRLPRLLREAGVRPRRRRSGAPRGSHPVALELRPDRQPRPCDRAPQRRALDHGELGGDRSRPRPNARSRRRSRSTTRSRSKKRSASTSRSKCGASWSSDSAGNASTKAASASTRPSTATSRGGRRRCSRKGCRRSSAGPVSSTSSVRRRRPLPARRPATCRAR